MAFGRGKRFLPFPDLPKIFPRWEDSLEIWEESPRPITGIQALSSSERLARRLRWGLSTRGEAAASPGGSESAASSRERDERTLSQLP